MTKKEIKANIKVLEKNGIALISNDGESYEFEAFTPAGGDMVIILDEPSKEKLQDYVDNFDINEEVLMWWRDGSGAGLPFANVRDHYNDLEEYIDHIDDICDMLDY
jgi:hypothetical protein